MTSLDAARYYHRLGVCVIPQVPGEKRPFIRWKGYQTTRPTEAELYDWFARQFPHAGVAAVLGPVSGLLVVDVDGPEAHQMLVDRLGAVPRAPTVISGSRKPSRFHLFFQHPDFDTGATATPWHPALEFRGKGGLVVLPPSRHRSGACYEWAHGLAPCDLSPPELPPAIRDALQTQAARIWQHRPVVVTPNVVAVPPLAGISEPTRDFLAGVYAAGPRWNDRLFAAACDLAGNSVPLEEAMPILLAGAQPVDLTEEENASRTIMSAYSQPRVPGRSYTRAESPAEPSGSWTVGEITVREYHHPPRRYLPPGCTVRSES
jgi:hypothetical protein